MGTTFYPKFRIFNPPETHIPNFTPDAFAPPCIPLGADASRPKQQLCESAFLSDCSLQFESAITDLETFVQCLEEMRCRLITYDLTIAEYQQLISSGVPLSDRIMKAIKDNPTEVAHLEDLPRKILQEKRYYLVWPGIKESMLYNMKNDACNFYMIDAGFKGTKTFALRKNSSFSNILGSTGLLLRENGLATGLQQKYSRSRVCDGSISKTIATTIDRTGWHAVSTFFVFYGCGIGVAVVIFVAELAIARLS